jgi:antitoxin component YwqK of YwqJK toxin-antitoxin module
MKKYYLSIVLLICSTLFLYAQDYTDEFNTRTILFDYPDSIVEINILILEKEFEIKDELKYYWYNNDKIGCNRGAVYGKPLHGAYTVSSTDGVLLTQGNFIHGLKQGKWKVWHISGEYKKIENWKNGLKDNIQKYYNEKGEIVKEVKYEKGALVENKETSLWKSIFKDKNKEDKALGDTIDSKVEAIEEESEI